jgi:hypothetical protein
MYAWLSASEPVEINSVCSSMDNQDKPAPTQAGGEGFAHQKGKKFSMRVYSHRLRT